MVLSEIVMNKEFAVNTGINFILYFVHGSIGIEASFYR